MTSIPLFQAPPYGDSSGGASGSRADLIQVDTALNSMRDSGFDLTAAVGEPIDNSIEAGASRIQVFTAHGSGKKSIQAIAFADNGRGIPRDTLAHALSMGYSTRYGQRGSLGRFGVGMKLAGLSLGTRIDVYTKESGVDDIHHAYVDLADIREGKQSYIESVPVDNWPEAYRAAMGNADGQRLNAGTLVIFSKIDRLSSGGVYGTSLEEKLSDLRVFIARAYRKFLDSGIKIELDGNAVTLLDPLFLMDNPRITGRYPASVKGTVIDEANIEITDKHSIHVTVALVPEEFRSRSGLGGDKDSQGRNIREFQIPDSAGKISMVRNGREINYDIVPKLLPSGIDKIDRYIGIEVTFPADLDEYFQVRNVKRGAVPVNKLREELRKWLERPVRQARKQIRALWDEVETREMATAGAHEAATDAAARAEKTAPAGQAGRDMTSEDEQRIIHDMLSDLRVDDEVHPDEAASIKQEIEAKPFTLVDGNWPGKELFEIHHLNSKAIVKLNHRHPFFRDVYDPIKQAAADGVDGADASELLRLLRLTDKALDVLFLAYAKAENMHREPDEQFDDLRSWWGQSLHGYMREVGRED